MAAAGRPLPDDVRNITIPSLSALVRVDGFMLRCGRNPSAPARQREAHAGQSQFLALAPFFCMMTVFFYTHVIDQD